LAVELRNSAAMIATPQRNTPVPLATDAATPLPFQ
jgi:hypothetical protein